LLGVASERPNFDGEKPRADRAEFQNALEASKLPARFWFDPAQDGKAGRIQTAWNTWGTLHVLDHHGVIRYKHVVRPELFENAVARLLKELADERAGAKRKQ